MSIEIFVLSDKRLGTIAEWQQAIASEGFDLRLDTSRPFEDLKRPSAGPPRRAACRL